MMLKRGNNLIKDIRKPDADPIYSNLIPTYAAVEAARRDMWGGRDPDPAEADQLAQCFEYEWNTAVTTMLQHWPKTPTWY